ncbi:MAG: Mor transcription activator-like protein [Alcaligenaceae bacterium]|nr:Mor transcription activator-like protein [Alcaligenaceae bacterium]
MSKLSPRMEAVRHELFTDILAQTKQVLIEMGVEDETADQAGIAIVDFLATHWGGQYVVIPMDYQFKVATRDIAMYRAHRGDFSATARQFGMTERGARKALERVTKRLLRKNQGVLFGLDENE